MKIIEANTIDREAWMRGVVGRRAEVDRSARDVAAEIVESIEARGDAASAEVVERFDRLRLRPEELLIEPQAAQVSAELVAAIGMAIKRIAVFHEPQIVHGYSIDSGGCRLQQDVRPLARVGIYVPGGAATYISTLLMCAIPAQLAGVPEIVVATTPRAASSPELQYVCRLLGIREIYRAGGAAGIAALAIGTESLRRVDKIVGPGNAWVAAAKQIVSSRVAVDLIAGPSEIVVLADDSADPRVVAADLLAQGEHGADCSPVCVTTSRDFAKALQIEIAAQLLDGGEQARAAVENNGAILLALDLSDAVAIIDAIAPEHLEIQIEEPDEVLAQINNCGAIFVGRWSGVAHGDYIAGTNHVLPTSGSARFSSPLGVYDFIKRRSVVRMSREAAGLVTGAAQELAWAEGLPLHARSLAIRESSEKPVGGEGR